MAGGWQVAALLPLDAALDWADKNLKSEVRKAWREDLHDWFSSLSAHALSTSRAPDPPKPPTFED